MQWSLFLLLLMGQCSFFMCHHYEYHFVKEGKTWTEAQQYCSEKYTDLATVSDMTDVRSLQKHLESAQNHHEAWIGLYSDPGQSTGAGSSTGADNRKWHWSLPGVEFNDEKINWAAGEPQYHENCVCIRNDSWLDFHCTVKKRFICYNESPQSNEKFMLIQTKMTWLQAQSYCRENHTDLVSGDEQLNQLPQSIVDKAKNPNNCFWIGLFRDTWRWSDGSDSSFRYWRPGDPALNNNDHKQCAMTTINGKWSSAECCQKKPFFCLNKTTTKTGTTAGPSSSTVTTDKTQGTTTKTGTTAGPSSSTVTTDKTQETTTKRGTTAGPSSSTVTTDKTQETTTKRGTTAGPSSSTVTTDKTQDKVILINESMTWEEALYHCRENYRDLVSITNQNEQRWVQEKAKKANSPYVWLGLRYTCTLDFWFWVNDDVVTYENWDTGAPEDDCDMSGAMDRRRDHKWFKKTDNEKFNFICSTC